MTERTQMSSTGHHERLRTALPPVATGFAPFDDQEASRRRLLRTPSRLAHHTRPIRQCRTRLTLSGCSHPTQVFPKVRLPPAPLGRYDGGAMQVSHLHLKQQRHVAHHVLVNTEHADAVEAVRVVDQHPLPAASTALLAVCHDTPSRQRSARW